MAKPGLGEDIRSWEPPYCLPPIVTSGKPVTSATETSDVSRGGFIEPHIPATAVEEQHRKVVAEPPPSPQRKTFGFDKHLHISQQQKPSEGLLNLPRFDSFRRTQIFPEN